MGTFTLMTQQATVHLGSDSLDNLHSTQNPSQRTKKQDVDATRWLVSEQTENQGISLVVRQDKSWKRTTLFIDQAVLLKRNTRINPTGQWDRVAEDMLLNFSESGDTVFHASSALERGAL